MYTYSRSLVEDEYCAREFGSCIWANCDRGALVSDKQ